MQPTEHQFMEWQRGLEELREALKQAGWFPPHSFALTNPDETHPSRRAIAYCYYCPRELPIGKERELGPQKALEKRREGFYWREQPFLSGETSQTYGSLSNLLYGAVQMKRTQIEYVRRSFLDIRFLTSKIGRIGNFFSDENRSVYEDLFLPHSSTRYRPDRPDGWRAQFQPGLPRPGAWNIQTQGNFRHVALFHPNETGIEREIQHEDDPYLIHIAESYSLFLIYQEHLPLNRQDFAFGNSQYYQELENWGPEHLPVEWRSYPCPAWLIRIIRRGAYTYEEVDAP